MALFKPVKLGSFQLQHRIVISPALRHSLAVDVEDYFRTLAPEGGLVLVPSLVPKLEVSTHKRIVDIIHDAKGVAFRRIGDGQGSSEGLGERLKQQVADAVLAGYDGIELDAGEGSMLQRALHGCESPSGAISQITDLLHSMVKTLPAERIGVRFAPFAMVNGVCLSNPLSLYSALIEAIKRYFPSLAFVHFVANTTFDDFEYAGNKSLDAFRAALAFPHNVDDQSAHGPLFVSSNDYSAESAHAIAACTNDLVSIGLASDANANIISLLRTKARYKLPASVSERLADINSTFRTGKEYVLAWDADQHARVMNAMNDLDSYLAQFDPALSYEGTDKKVVWRKSCWFACDGIGHPLLDTEDDIAKFDGDLKDGLTGLRALQDGQVRSSLEYLKYVLDSALVTTSQALGIGNDMIQRCTVRYRIIKYTAHAGNPGGIGLHPDGNLLSALITNGPGLGVYDFDGTFREPGFNGTIMMGGSTLYRWSQGTYRPTFHNVNIDQEQVKVSIVAFFNFPDMVKIPRSVAVSKEQSSFFHDIRRIKQDDKSPTGELAPLWDIIIEKHKLVLPPATEVHA